jgi:hypothetical protein
MRRLALLCTCICALIAGGGCAALRELAAKTSSGEMGVPGGDGKITPAELDELTRAFADRYVGLLSSTCDALKKNNPDPVQRREAQELLLNCATNVYDIASNADAFTRMLDLVVVTTLVSQVWIDDDRAGDIFGERGEVLVRALHHGRVEAWALAAQVLRPDQLELLDYTMWDWRQHNPDMVHMPFVRFSNFAIGRGKSATAEVLAAGGFFGNVGKAGQSVDAARLLSERMFWQLKREGTLLRWQVEATKDDIIATPELSTYVKDVSRLTDQLEQLPHNVATERKALLTAFDERTKSIDATINRVKDALAEARGTATSAEAAGKSLNQMFTTADALFGHRDSVNPNLSPATQPLLLSTPSIETSRPFDVREYTQGVKELAAAIDQMNLMLKSSDELLASPQWDSRIRQLGDSADGRIRVAAQQSRIVTDRMFLQLYLAIGLLFALLILYRLFAHFLARRLKVVQTTSVKPGHNGDGNGQPAPALQREPHQTEVSA